MGNRKRAERHAIEASATHVEDTYRAPRKAALRPGAINELELFFASAESTFGMSSKFAGLVNMAMSGGMGSGRNHTEDATIARVAPSDKRDRPVESMVAVHRAVLAALRAIGEPHRTVLWAAHDHFVSPPEVKRELNVVARVALMTPAASSGYAESGRTGEPIEQWLIRACSREEDIAQIAKEAEAMLDVAYRAYAAAREPEPGRKGVGAFRKRDRTPRAPVPRRSVSAAFDPEGWRP